MRLVVRDCFSLLGGEVRQPRDAAGSIGAPSLHLPPSTQAGPKTTSASLCEKYRFVRTSVLLVYIEVNSEKIQFEKVIFVDMI
ncbi:hypothetical protein [Martelella radicis]|uniref:Uncharacterized protein n=1 Tax=Martelella radicis TaxID=1397476 RepID=A0A7W6PBR0_9HYPH|nr:hypothetical protein [Martelella radicis]MBB4123701.1 hypothetical protein [Martelella radicis]